MIVSHYAETMLLLLPSFLLVSLFLLFVVAQNSAFGGLLGPPSVKE